MRSVFWKIFIWFWAAMVAVGVIFALSAVFMSQDSLVFKGRERVGRVLTVAGRIAVGLHRRGAPLALELYVKRVEADSGHRLFLFRDGKLLAPDRPLPPGSQALVRRAEAAGKTRFALFRKVPMAAAPITDGQGNAYVILAQVKGGPLYRLLHPNAGEVVRWVMVILASGLVCFFLARHMTRPLALLQQATRGFARGEFGLRVLPKMGRRRDEFRELGAGFDDMAAKVQALIQARTQLMRDLSHELRSPLTRLHLELALVRKNAGDPALPVLDRMEEELDQMNHLIGRIMTLARLEHLDAPLEIQELDLDAMVQSIIRDAQFQLQPDQLDYQAQACRTIQGNADLIRSAVENLILNALKHTPAGTRVQLQLLPRDSGVEIQVRDWGPGVPEADLSHLFTPFYQAEGTAPGRGSGVGLAIVRGAVQRHGGRVSARNCPDGGLAVLLWFPLSPKVS